MGQNGDLWRKEIAKLSAGAVCSKIVYIAFALQSKYNINTDTAKKNTNTKKFTRNYLNYTKSQSKSFDCSWNIKVARSLGALQNLYGLLQNFKQNHISNSLA